MDVVLKEHKPESFYFDEDIANDAEAMRQLVVFDNKLANTPWGELPGADSLNNEDHWLQNKGEEFYNGMHAAIKTALWLISNKKYVRSPEDAQICLLGLRYDLLKIYHKKSFKSPEQF